MKTFDITARDKAGKIVRRVWQAPSQEHARKLAQNEKLLVTAVKEQSQPLGQRALNRRVKPKAILSLLREIQTIVEAGVPVTEALVMIQSRPDNPRLTATLHDINADIKRGKPLADAFRQHPDVFEPALATTFQIGMSSGGLGPALSRYQRDLALRVELARKFRKVMIYPAFLLGLLALVLVVLFIFILPNFVDLYAEFDAALPGPTQILMRTVATAPIWLAALLALWAVGWVGYHALRQTRRGKHWLDGISLRLPVFGRLRHEGQMAQIASSLSLLLHAGTPLRTAVNLVRSNLNNSVLSAQLAQIEHGLSMGKRFSELSQTNGLFLGPSQGLIAAGERTGALDQMLGQVAKLHEENLNESVDVVTSLIEPLMMIFVGGVIGVIVITVYLPIFGVTNVIE